jgi:hypothetical protein
MIHILVFAGNSLLRRRRGPIIEAPLGLGHLLGRHLGGQYRCLGLALLEAAPLGKDNARYPIVSRAGTLAGSSCSTVSAGLHSEGVIIDSSRARDVQKIEVCVRNVSLEIRL